MADADEPGDLPPAVRQQLIQFGGAAGDVEKRAGGFAFGDEASAGAAVPVVMASASRRKSGSGIALQTLCARCVAPSARLRWPVRIEDDGARGESVHLTLLAPWFLNACAMPRGLDSANVAWAWRTRSKPGPRRTYA